MATIEDLNFRAFTDMSHDEAIENLRQIRLSRRVSDKKVSVKKTTVKAKNVKAPELTPEQAERLLKMIGG
jgi:methionine synthase II (cobalamin-independent)